MIPTTIRPTAHRLFRIVERLLWGGRTRERVLCWLLHRHYRSLYRRQWRWVAGEEEPHFYDHRISSYDFFNGTWHPLTFYRGFFASHVMRPTDHVLDIGCGDGFFANRFFAYACASVDAIDIEPDAIEHAQAHNAHPRVRYVLGDAVQAPFPRSEYDVVVWDGALGHFASRTTDLMFRKIAAALAEDGVFVGSESLGVEGHDHLQFFSDLDDLADHLRAVFEVVEVTEVEYDLPGGYRRREGFWRASPHPDRLAQASWRRR